MPPPEERDVRELDKRTGGKIFLIVIDAGEWEVIDTLIENNELPNFKKLKEEGSYGNLISPSSKSSVEWTSLASGKVKEKHGIEDYIIDNRLITSGDVKSKRIWDFLGEYKIKVGIYNWKIATWPPEKVRGFMVSYHPQNEDLTYPQALRNELFSESLYYIEEISESKSTHETIFYLLDKFNPDFFAIGDNHIHKLEHQLWKYWEPEKFNVTNETEIGQGRKIITDSYKRVDDLIGEILNLGTIFVVSDYGMKAHETMEYVIDFNKIFDEFGIKLRDCRCEARSGGIVDLELCSDSNISEETIRLLSEIKYSNSNETFFKNIELVNKNRLDAMIDMNSPHFPKKFELANSSCVTTLSLSLPIKTIHITIHEESGEHPKHTDGIILVRGPLIRENFSIENVVTYNIAPTILYLYRIPVPTDMDGRVLIEMIKPEYLTPIRYTEKSSQKDFQEIGAQIEINKTLTEEIEEKLRELGYIS